MDISSVAIYSQADAGSLHVAEADEKFLIGPAPANESYLKTDAIIALAKQTGAQAIHPGYGFLSENADFAQKCEEQGLRFIGPTPENIRLFGLKHTAREIAEAQRIPLAPGTNLLTDIVEAKAAAADIGYPVILKATAGGGGIGMKICYGEADILEGFDSVARMGAGSFGDAGVFLEKYIEVARHIEVQVFGDGKGRVVALGERDCSLQRRNQKVVEETPAPHLPSATRQAMLDSAVKLMSAANYRSAGTVEYLYDVGNDRFYFLEVNTRLQVEHGITEEVTGVDLVSWMVRGAAGDYSFMDVDPPAPEGASIQVRIYAEDPAQNYRPSSGRLTQVQLSRDVRVDHWVEAGSDVSAFYDPMLAKLIVRAANRNLAIAAIQQALSATVLTGIATNVDWLRTVVRSDGFTSGDVSTRMLDALAYQPTGLTCVSAGLSTTVQDYPGRLGYWDVGVPPSGPMDSLAFRLGNRIIGNAQDAAGIEFTASGPTFVFNQPCLFVLAGAQFDAALDGIAVEPYRPVEAKRGQTLAIGRVSGAGLRGYLLVAGGIDAPQFLGSRAAFTLGEFGGHAGRAIAPGDTIQLLPAVDTRALALESVPHLSKTWQLRVLYGPHGAPDFFTEDDVAMLTSADWQVHYNSNRTGVRLVGPKPEWARRDGGEAGLHPSNIHDNAYAIGAVDFTGDMPIILGPDGPSLGGFVCPFVVIEADLWKVGQLAPGDTLRFVPVAAREAVHARASQDAWLDSPTGPMPAETSGPPEISPILHYLPAENGNPAATYRRQGDRNLLIEYGPIVLDLELRLRVHALMVEVQRRALPGIVDVTPGIRSLQIHFDSRILSQDALLATLIDVERNLDGLEDFEIPSRIIHLPLSWGDPAVQQTIDKYISAVRDDAPWCPDNVEFIRRINGLQSTDDVKRIVFDAHYLVMGLGDVYLGAPVATPVDPRHRLVTTKYNPARTWTPPNVVGIGGAYMCIYGMEGPGGYQLFGRTIQVWNSWRQTEDFIEGKPWLLRFFDQIRFFPVSADELTEWRRDFPLGRRKLKVEETVFRLSDYRRFLADNADCIAAFQKKRDAAFQAERNDWAAKGEFDRVAALVDSAEASPDGDAAAIPKGCDAIESPLGGSIWKVLIAEGDRVAKGDKLAIIEAMKMETPIVAARSGIIRKVFVVEGKPVHSGMAMFAIDNG